jgi:3,4-dihydroxy 2-butanone 4-phosphate synthase / GTP cyclohydrolase II
MQLISTEALIASIKDGEIVIVMDDEHRENEGDFFMAATKVTPEKINFMLQYGRGLLCMPMTKAHVEQLALPLMTVRGKRTFPCNFTWSIEASSGVTTGISAFERAHTIRTAANPQAKPSDIVTPGHVFPIMAQDNGVLTRPGHTEAAVDLVRLAGFHPVAVLIEILNQDGTMARRDDLIKIAARHQLKIGTIHQLIEYRKTHHV